MQLEQNRCTLQRCADALGYGGPLRQMRQRKGADGDCQRCIGGIGVGHAGVGAVVPAVGGRTLKIQRVSDVSNPLIKLVLSRAAVSETDDPVLGQFLGILSRDITVHPDHLQALDTHFVRRLQSPTTSKLTLRQMNAKSDRFAWAMK